MYLLNLNGITLREFLVVSDAGIMQNQWIAAVFDSVSAILPWGLFILEM